MGDKIYKIGLIGYGGFGSFLYHSWKPLKNVEISAVADPHLAKTERWDGKKIQGNYQDILQEDLDLIAIATPPNTHAEIAVACMEAGKNILIEKPLATTLEDAEKILQTRDAMQKVAGINLIMRFNPLILTLQHLVREKTFGELRRVTVENYAQDASLPKEHWFWKKEISGGILIEHGVHFIDLVHFISPAPPVEVSGMKYDRHPWQEDRMSANILYKNGLLASHYHSFARPGFFETTKIKLAYDLADLDVFGWIPLGAEVKALVNEKSKQTLLANPQFQIMESMPIKEVTDESRPRGWGPAQDPNSPQEQWVRSGGITYQADELITGQLLTRQSKQEVYAGSVRASLLDVLKKTANAAHPLTAPLEAGLESLQVAVRATESARTGKKILSNLWLAFAMALITFSCTPNKELESIDLINTDHLEHLYEEIVIDDDSMGIIWIYAEAPDYHLVADEDEGFTCVDDVARALVFYCRQYPRTPSRNIEEKIHALSEFLLFMQAENGYFYNFLLPGPRINTSHENSQAIANWWSWRAFWALSEVSLLEAQAFSELQARCSPVLDRLFKNMQGLCTDSDKELLFEGISTPECLAVQGADQVGVMMIGLSNYYRIQPSEAIKELLISLGELLLKASQGNENEAPYYAFLSWRNYWHAWGNSQAYALLYCGQLLQHPTFIEAGLNEVRYFYPYCLENNFLSGFSMARENGRLQITGMQTFSQIAYGIRPMVYASLEAYSITGDTTFATTAGHLASWFFGNNPAEQAMYDPASGRTFDGISSPEAINRNAGAESTIEGLLSIQAVHSEPAAWKTLKNYIER